MRHGGHFSTALFSSCFFIFYFLSAMVYSQLKIFPRPEAELKHLLYQQKDLTKPNSALPLSMYPPHLKMAKIDTYLTT